MKRFLLVEVKSGNIVATDTDLGNIMEFKMVYEEFYNVTLRLEEKENVT